MTTGEGATGGGDRGAAWRFPRSTVALAGLSLCYWAGFTLVRPLVAPYAEALGATAVQAALIVGSQAVIAFAAALPIGRLNDQIDSRKVLIAGSSGTLVAGAILVLASSLGGLVASQVIFGPSTLMVWLAIQDLMTKGPRRHGRIQQISELARHRQIANHTVLVSAGQLIGPFAGGVLVDGIGFRPTFAVFAALAGCLVLLGLAMPRLDPGAGPESRAHESLRPFLVRAYADAGRLMTDSRGVRATFAASFLAIYISDLRVSFLPLVLRDNGFSLTQAGALLSLAAGLAMLSRPLLPLLLHRVGPAITVAVCLVPGSALLALTGISRSTVVVTVLIAGHGLAIGLAQPLTLSLVTMVTSPGQQGLALGGRLMAHRFAQWCGPAAFGGAAAVIAVVPAFALVAAVAAPLAMWNGRAVAQSIPRPP